VLERLLELDIAVMDLGTVVVAAQVANLLPEPLKIVLSLHLLELVALLLNRLTILLFIKRVTMGSEGKLADLSEHSRAQLVKMG